jgi:hypothetical protein
VDAREIKTGGGQAALKLDEGGFCLDKNLLGLTMAAMPSLTLKWKTN